MAAAEVFVNGWFAFAPDTSLGAVVAGATESEGGAGFVGGDGFGFADVGIEETEGSAGDGSFCALFAAPGIVGEINDVVGVGETFVVVGKIHRAGEALLFEVGNAEDFA